MPEARKPDESPSRHDCDRNQQEKGEPPPERGAQHALVDQERRKIRLDVAVLKLREQLRHLRERLSGEKPDVVVLDIGYAHQLHARFTVVNAKRPDAIARAAGTARAVRLVAEGTGASDERKIHEGREAAREPRSLGRPIVVGQLQKLGGGVKSLS